MERPNRSDSHLPPEEEARREEEIREYFDGMAPKRHTKPSRSEYSSVYSDDLRSSDKDCLPELDKLRHLEADQVKLVCDKKEAEEEYVETEYYKDLNCVDKQHHTTGTGFIKMEKSNGSFNLISESTTSLGHVSGHGNPATNEWIPSADVVITVELNNYLWRGCVLIKAKELGRWRMFHIEESTVCKRSLYGTLFSLDFSERV